MKFNKEQMKKKDQQDKPEWPNRNLDPSSPLIFVDRSELGNWSVRVSRTGTTVTITIPPKTGLKRKPFSSETGTH